MLSKKVKVYPTVEALGVRGLSNMYFEHIV